MDNSKSALSNWVNSGNVSTEIDNLFSWRIVPRHARAPTEATLPPGILTHVPQLRHESLPDEVPLLLPNRDGARALIQCVSQGMYTGHGLGLFLADPFLSAARVSGDLHRIGITWITNLPTVEQQDVDFSAQLADVGLDRSREFTQLAAFKTAEFRIAACIADADGARDAVAISPDALIVLPRIADFAAGFPSFRQRGAAADAIAEIAHAQGWRGPILGLGEQREAESESLWPAILDGLICRPSLFPITHPR